MISFEKFLKKVRERIDFEFLYKIWKKFYPLSVAEEAIDFQIERHVAYYYFFKSPDERDLSEITKETEEFLTKTVEVF